MAEIKSAIELAMERTKNMIPTGLEKEKIREEEDISKAAALVNRFLHVDMHFKDLEKELAKFDPGDRKRMGGLMLAHLGEAVSLEGDQELVFEGIAALHGSEDVVAKIRELKKEYEEERVREFDRVREDLRRELSEAGISGSAVQPKVEGSEAWRAAESRFRPPFEKRLAGFVGELKK
jgi:hypothetical protein